MRMRPEEFKQKLMALEDKMLKLPKSAQQELYDIADKYELIYNELIITDSYNYERELELLDNYYSELITVINGDGKYESD